MKNFIAIITFILSFCVMCIVGALIKTGFDFNYVFARLLMLIRRY